MELGGRRLKATFNIASLRLASFLVAAGAFVGLVGCATIDLAPTQAPTVRIEEAHLRGATRVEFNADGSRIATGGNDGDIRVWTVPDGTRLRSMHGHEGKVRGLIWMDDQTLVSGAEDGRLLVWDLKSEATTQSAIASPITAVVRIPNQDRILTGHKDGRVQLWSYPQLNPLAEFGMGGRVLSLAMRPDGEQLAASNNRGEVILLTPDLGSSQHLRTAGKDAHELRYAPNGRQLAAGTWFHLHFWDLSTGELTVKSTEHMGAVISLDYTPDGRQLVSFGRHTDAKIRLLNVHSGRLDRRLASHNLCGYSIRVGPRGRFIATASEDESVRLYDIGAAYQPTWSLQAGEEIYARK